MGVSEADAIDAVTAPATANSLAEDLNNLGIEPGDTIVVHSSLSSLGWVAGGAQSVVEALRAAVGPGGTLVMPTQSGHLSDPADWSNPPIPEHWVDQVRDALPAYDPDLTGTRSMGAVVECFRHHRDTKRSGHPLVSFAANGPASDEIVGSHPITEACGETSPLARLYDRDAKVLLLGVGHGNNTSIHLAEHRADWPTKTSRLDGAPMLVNGQRTWVTYEDLDRTDEDFDDVGAAFAGAGLQRSGQVGAATAHVMSQRTLVDFATNWFNENR